MAARPPARAATADSLVMVWNEEVLEAIKAVRRGPTVNARALANRPHRHL